jgi:alkylation response protein AidB-like acyl-CoA dehydrogenase
VRVEGEWDPLGMRGTVSRTLIFENVFVPFEEQLMPRGVYFNAAKQWPHMFMTLTPSYMGIAQAAYDFTVRYLRGEQAGTALAANKSLNACTAAILPRRYGSLMISESISTD